MRTAVVGHVEWVVFARVTHVPRPGEIVHAEPSWEGPGGGGAGAAVQLTKLSDETVFFTALGDDDLGHKAADELAGLGLRTEIAWRDEPTRRGFTHVDAEGERTITILGKRLAPRGDDHLAWDELANADAVYFTAGDAEALRRARTSRVLVATSRVLDAIYGTGVRLDALVGSALDSSESYSMGSLEPPPDLVVMTEGERGGTYWTSTDIRQSFSAPALSAPITDRYGAGDSFAAGLTFALGEDATPSDAVSFAARCGAAVLTDIGPFEGQLTRADIARN